MSSSPPGSLSSSSPAVTVSITRRVDPAHVPEVTRWVQAGVNLANRWPGFLGSGWARATATSDDWHMLYRFADAMTLDAWECSDERARWLEGGAGLVEEKRVDRLTGMEGWFDSPHGAAADTPGSPPRWKQAVSIWLGFFPVNLLFTLLATAFIPGWDSWTVFARVLVTTLVLTPLMAYVVLPWVTRTLRPWLLGEAGR